VIVTSEEPLYRNGLVERVAGALKRGRADAQAHVSGLADARLIDSASDPGSPVSLTEQGQRLYASVRGQAAEITQRLWGDLPPEDLAAAGRVLSTVLARAESELDGIG
jgi:DNA-binding MarR family transcriptional regulator